MPLNCVKWMTPARGVAVLGTPGGSRIISMVLLSALAWHEGADANDMVSLKRYHHQYLPDKIFYEPDAFTDEIVGILAGTGHSLTKGDSSWGNMNVVTWDYATDEVQAASDPRGDGQGRVY